MLSKFLDLALAKKIALVTALVSLSTCAVLILASYQGSRQLIQHSTELLGHSLTGQLARDAANPLVQGDKLGLQAQLLALVDNSLVVQAAIYDVENRPIAEAGIQSQGESFSASITFQDSLAGYAVLVLNPTQLQREAQWLAWQLLALALLLMALAYLLSLIPARHLNNALSDLTHLAGRPTSLRRPSYPAGYRGIHELQTLAEVLINGPASAPPTPGSSAVALLTVEIENLETLPEQFDSRQLVALLQDFHQQLETICTLYDGKLRVSRSNAFSATFARTDEDESYPFRALCSGHLIEQWMSQQQAGLNIRLGLGLSDYDQSQQVEQQLARQYNLEQTLSIGRTGGGLLAASTELQEHPSVQDRVLITPINDRVIAIDALTEPYEALLNRQLSTLGRQFEH